jgi:serine/threonine protein phosphatase 1
MGLFKRLSRGLKGGQDYRPHGRAGARAYAVGDIHGRLDLLDELLAMIEADNAGRPEAKTYIVFLGDLIDRGPDSAGVVERLRHYDPAFARPIFLAGNHEEVFLRILHGEIDILPDWLQFGGAECIQSYGLDAKAIQRMEPEEALERLKAAVPQGHVEFVEGFCDTFRCGDYLFVHAGIRPGIDLDEQDQFDLRWIREPFLSGEEEHGMMIVHGHTIVPAVEERLNRIGIDTGAYHSGVLTALGIEDDRRWYLATAAAERE